jgi:hypothetical protein
MTEPVAVLSEQETVALLERAIQGHPEGVPEDNLVQICN